ncbi:MAG: hypothetical protein KGD63_10610 [Candidatus Lokiarchaeota archaeon]|nr:hypothetical protein [Candidatus Lokiarchaeota archaeon]
MVIREAGLLFRGKNLVNIQYHATSEEIDEDIRSALITAIIDFVEIAFDSNNMKYLGGDKYIIAFIENKITSIDMTVPESFYAYLIIDKEKKMEKYFKKVIRPLLIKVTNRFKSAYDGKYLSEITQFLEFKKELDKILGSATQTVDQKLHSTF